MAIAIDPSALRVAIAFDDTSLTLITPLTSMLAKAEAVAIAVAPLA